MQTTISTTMMLMMATFGPQTGPASAAGPAPAAQPNQERNMQGEHFKRKGPKPLPPVVLHGVRYTEERDARARGFGQPGGVVVAIDPHSGKELWLVQIYQTNYTSEETDVQDVFISQMLPNADGSTLLITNERKQRFVLDLASRSVTVLD
jgi:hypothetical protein